MSLFRASSENQMDIPSMTDAELFANLEVLSPLLPLLQTAFSAIFLHKSFLAGYLPRNSSPRIEERRIHFAKKP